MGVKTAALSGRSGEKGKVLVQGTHLTELLLGVAPVRPTKFLESLVLSEFDRTRRQRFDLPKTCKERSLKKLY